MYNSTNPVRNSNFDTVSNSYSDPFSSSLCPLFPHKFLFYTCEQDKTKCLSMETFLQSLRVKDAALQKYICENFSGYFIWKLKSALNDWRKDGMVYWNGKAILRVSDEYTNLITTAYDKLFEQNHIFRNIVLPHFKGKIPLHSLGGAGKDETLLTEEEYLFQLNRLIGKL